MFNISDMKGPYEAAIQENWEALKAFFDDDGNAFNILNPLTVAEDTAFHIVVHSKSAEPLQHLLERVEDPTGDSVFTTNAHGNTVLHEAAIHRNIAAVKVLVGHNYVTPQQLVKKNMSGHTPLFKAASFGSTKVVRYLASQPNQTSDNKLRDEHRTRNDGTSILHAAVRGEHFGTALELLKLDEGLAELKTKGMTSLYLLTNIQSAFSSKYRNKFWHRLVNHYIPIGEGNNDDAENIDDDDDQPVEVGDNQSRNAYLRWKIFLQTINKSFWKSSIRAGWPIVRKIWEEKRKHKFAFELAQKLIKNDKSWQYSFTQNTITDFRPLAVEHRQEIGEQSEKPEELNDHHQIVINREENCEEDPEDDDYKVETPLLAATRTGMIDIVREILKEHPQAVEYINHKKQNILHVAASHRQREVFELVKEMRIPTSRLILGIDDESYTVLQHVADTRNYTGGTRAGPAYQLQEELEWFKSVEDIMPSFFTKHRDKRNLTAKDIFDEKHKEHLKEAQKWIKGTSQSCSAVAVLVATVVFAAAFTLPGGTNNNNGRPVLRKKPFFLFFVVSDVVSLSSSLTAVVMFLSILISPFELENFRVSLPRRLTLGFALLFTSMATTMIAFTSTVFLVIRLDRRRPWTATLICCAAFFPVSALALTHFPLFASFIKAWRNLFKAISEAFPCNLLAGARI